MGREPESARASRNALLMGFGRGRSRIAWESGGNERSPLGQRPGGGTTTSTALPLAACGSGPREDFPLALRRQMGCRRAQHPRLPLHLMAPRSTRSNSTPRGPLPVDSCTSKRPVTDGHFAPILRQHNGRPDSPASHSPFGGGDDSNSARWIRNGPCPPRLFPPPTMVCRDGACSPEGDYGLDHPRTRRAGWSQLRQGPILPRSQSGFDARGIQPFNHRAIGGRGWDPQNRREALAGFSLRWATARIRSGRPCIPSIQYWTIARRFPANPRQRPAAYHRPRETESGKSAVRCSVAGRGQTAIRQKGTLCVASAENLRSLMRDKA